MSDDKFAKCKDSLLWVQQHLHPLNLAGPCKTLPFGRRLPSHCYRARIRYCHSYEEKLHGSALALVRLQFEAYIRGMWLAHSASDSEIDQAGRDEFPKIDYMIAALEMPGLLDNKILSAIKADA